jgi:hypothetical protein
LSSKTLPFAAAALSSVALAACGSTYSIPIGACPTLPPPSPTQPTVSVEYLGVGGFLLRRGDDVILTAPLYSNPSLLEVGLDHAIRPDVELIDRLLPKEAAKAQAILVGHSHYDHLLDVPYVALHKAVRANVYGSETTRRLLASLQAELAAKTPATQVVSLDELAQDDQQAGRWVPLGAGLRFMAIRSEHSHQATLKLPFLDQPFPIHLWRGGEERTLAHLPRSASDWPEGRVFSFLIDFLDAAGRPVFRAYYQDSGTNEPTGYPPESLLAEKAVDLAILCVGGDFERLANHPRGILDRTKPRFVLLSHWEDFFVTQDVYAKDGRVYEIPPADQKKTARFLKLARRALPPDARLWVPCPSRSRFDLPIR